MSGEFHDMLTTRVQGLCRRVDVVTVKGSKLVR
jgi:hypothetical protein